MRVPAPLPFPASCPQPLLTAWAGVLAPPPADWAPAALEAFGEELGVVSRRGALSVKATLRCGDVASPMEMVGDGVEHVWGVS